jgi:hypothetical protein
VDDEPVAGRTDRVADRDAAAVDVDDVVRESEFGLRAGHDGPERFVDLDDVEIAGADPLLLARLLDCAGGLGMQRVVRPRDLA